ncbi:MAG TPA: DUF222 domain-containing protein [Mycobacteriales bacterium]|nr:DUF222 domain-containing protein [Mycobacteriales bacterium]
MGSELDAAIRRTADRITLAEQMPVGGLLMLELDKIAVLPMDAYCAVRLHALYSKLESHLAARRMIAASDAVHRLHGKLDFPVGEARMLAAQEIACATRTSYVSAMTGVGVVERVRECLAASWVALDRGEITMAHLTAVERATRHCPAHIAEAVDARVVALAVERAWTPSQTAKAARTLIVALDPHGAADRAAQASNDADVSCYPDSDGMATLIAHGPAVQSQQLMTAINRHAESLARDGDHRPVGVRRFAALYDLVFSAAGAANGGPGSGAAAVVRVETQVRIDLATLLGGNDHPGELVGYGPITADAARALAADSVLRRLVTDPLTGDTLDLGLRSYRPTAALKRLILAQHPTCTMPGCNRPADTSQIDHRHERRDGGRTDRINLKPMCLMHHQMKTKKRWKVDLNPDGSETWTSYLGFTYTRKPNWFPLPEPLELDDQPPDHIDERIPDHTPDPPDPDEPLPEPPPLTHEQYEEMEHALDTLHAFGETFQQWCDRHYDQARATGLVA